MRNLQHEKLENFPEIETQPSLAAQKTHGIVKKMEFDVILPVAPKDAENLSFCIERIIQNIDPRKIIVLASAVLENKIQNISNVEFINEDMLYDGLTLSNISALVETKAGKTARSNWYFQQFIKMAYACKSETDYYLIWDSDTIPLRKINFWDDSGKCLFAMKTEYYLSYFKTIGRLFSGEVCKMVKKSFIAEHMMIQKECMLEMIEMIEKNDKIYGEKFYEKIIHAIYKEDIAGLAGLGFSEFETYGNYVARYYPNIYNMRELKTLREGGLFIDKKNVNNKTLDWMAKKYETVSFEEHPPVKDAKKIRSALKIIVLCRLMPFRCYTFLFRVINKIRKIIEPVPKLAS